MAGFADDKIVERGQQADVTVIGRDGQAAGLRSPALCLAELSAAISRRTPEDPLAAGELVSSGTLTESQPIAAGESWTASVAGIGLSPVTLSIA